MLLFACLMAVLGLWYWSLGSVSVSTVNTPKVEAFYSAAITFSQTLGTALGDWIADAGLGFGGENYRIRRRTDSARCSLFLDECLGSCCSGPRLSLLAH